MTKQVRVQRAGIVLAGYDDPTIVPSAPLWTDFRGDGQNDNLINALAEKLFYVPKNDAWQSGRLDELRRNLLARILAADEAVVQKYGEDYILHRELLSKANQLNIAPSLLKTWGRRTRDAFAMRNRMAANLEAGATLPEKVLCNTDTLCTGMESLQLSSGRQEDKMDNIIQIMNVSFV